MGLIAGLSLCFLVEDNYESRLFDALAGEVLSKSSSAPLSQRDSMQIVVGMSLVNDIVKNRQPLFSNASGVKMKINPVTTDLMTGSGACGSYSLIMARLLHEMNFDTRIIQMKVGDVYGGHIILETKLDNKWVVLDPLYNLAFTNEMGNLASFKEVQENWDYYARQVPDNYDLSYDYAGLRYTNWDKVPIVMPVAKKLVDWAIGKEAGDRLSLRILVLRKFKFLFIVSSFVQGFLFIYALLLIVKRMKSTIKKQVNEGSLTDNSGNVKVIVVEKKALPQTILTENK